jgi:rubrerythrin
MGKAAKAHKAKVAKRNANLKVQEKRMQKVWQEAFQEQMEKMKEQFALMSGDTMSGLTGLLEDEENTQTDITEEESESVEPISGDQTV